METDFGAQKVTACLFVNSKAQKIWSTRISSKSIKVSTQKLGRFLGQRIFFRGNFFYLFCCYCCCCCCCCFRYYCFYFFLFLKMKLVFSFLSLISLVLIFTFFQFLGLPFALCRSVCKVIKFLHGI